MPTETALLLLRLRRHGLAHPYWTVWEAGIAKLGLPVACAMLQLESGGGAMVYGHDVDRFGPCPGYGWGTVTEANYAHFKHLRDVSGRSNGVGGCQLTSPDLQNRADALGGCWRIRCNYAVGFNYLHDLIRAHGSVEAGFAAYNGSGPAAQQYGHEAYALASRFASLGCGTYVGVW